MGGHKRRLGIYRPDIRKNCRCASFLTILRNILVLLRVWAAATSSFGIVLLGLMIRSPVKHDRRNNPWFS
jgi:hypothetical protein